MADRTGDVDYSGIEAFTRGDERQARDLRATIAVIARRTEDPALRDLCVKVLRGGESVRRVFEHQTFWDMAGASMDNLERGLEELSDEQREAVMEQVGRDGTDDEVIEDLMNGRDLPADPGDDTETDTGSETEPDPPPRDHSPPRWG